MQVCMANLLHLERRAGRNHDIIIAAIISRVGLTGSAHWIQVNRELPPQISCRRQLQIHFRTEQHLGKWFVIAVCQRRISFTMMLPNDFQSSRVIELLQQRNKSGDISSVRRKLCFLHLQRFAWLGFRSLWVPASWRERRTGQGERQRDILCQLPGSVGLLVLLIKLTHCLAGFLRFCRSLNTLRHFRADLSPQWIGYAQFLVVATRVNRRQNRKKGFTGVEGHLGRVLSQTHAYPQPENSRKKPASVLRTQENLLQGGGTR